MHQVAKGQFVELELQRNDRIFVVLAEFGDRYSTPAGKPAPNVPTTRGPLHNQIAQPDRTVDNSTIWQPDYNRAHFEDMYFNRMRKYYETQSSGRYTFNGEVTEWVRVPFNGLLITYWDTIEQNNNVSAGQAPFTSPWSAPFQAYDSTFGLEPTDPLSLPFYGSPTAGAAPVQFTQNHPSLPAVPLFNDMNQYWFARTSASGVIVPQTGTSIRVVSTSAHDRFMQIQVMPAK